MRNLFNLLSAMCGKIKKADLSQNDPEAADYVKGVIRQESLPEGYPYKTETVNVILPETEFTTVDNDGTYMSDSEATGELIIGNTYNVTFNGDKYTCVAYDANVAPAIGNGKLIGGDDTGEPFFFAFTKGMAVLFTESADTYIISVKETADSCSKIDENYLPDSVAGSPIEFVVSEDGTSVSCDLSSEELLSLSVHDLQKRCVLVDGSMKLIPQSIATGTLTSAHGYHTTITFAETYCSSVKAYVRDPVYVVIRESGELKYITDTEFKEADIVRTASPGQTIVVKSVDDTGRPTEWEAVDMPKDFVVTVFADDSGNPSADRTFDEVLSAHKDGKDVVLKSDFEGDTTIYRLSEIAATVAIFSRIYLAGTVDNADVFFEQVHLSAKGITVMTRSIPKVTP